MVVLPADHVITKVPAFHDCLKTAIERAAVGMLVTFGIRALHPETCYLNAPRGGSCTRKVFLFRKNPERAKVKDMLAEGS